MQIEKEVSLLITVAGIKVCSPDGKVIKTLYILYSDWYDPFPPNINLQIDNMANFSNGLTKTTKYDGYNLLPLQKKIIILCLCYAL